MEERRKFVRLDTRLKVSYTVVPAGQVQEAKTRNISEGGVCIFTDSEMDSGTQLAMTIHLPDRPTPIQCIAEVMWNEPYEVIGKGLRYRCVESGVRFVEISPEDLEAIKQHVILSLQVPSRRTP